MPAATSLPFYARPRMYAWILGGSLVAAIGTGFWVRGIQITRARARFDGAVEESWNRLEQRICHCEDLLRGVRGLAQVQGGMYKSQFRHYLQAVGIETRYPGLLGVTYGVPVEVRDRESVLARLRAEQNRPELQVHPGWGFEGDTLVLYGEPEATNAGALGFNSASSPAQRDSLLAARDTGLPQASPPMPVAQAPREPGMVLRLAVYRTAEVPGTPQERRNAFSGCVNAVFLIQNLAEDSFQRAELEGIQLGLIDLHEPDRTYLESAAPPSPHWWQRFGPQGFGDAREINVGGHRWKLDFKASRSFFQPAEVALPWIAAGTVLTLGGLLAGLLRSWSRTGQRAQSLAQRMTEELRYSEARLRAIARVMPDAILVLDGEGRYREVLTQDPSRLALPPDQLLGRRLHDVLPRELANTMLQTIRRVLQDRREHVLDYSFEASKGSLQHFNARVTPMEEDFEEQPCVLWAARDVTERTSQDAALLQTQKLESLGVLAGGIAHDFNNLLTAIQGHLSLMQLALDEGRDPLHHLDRMNASIQRAADLARQLLAYSGRASFQIQVLDLNGLVDEMSSLLGVSRSKLVSLDVQLEPGLPPIQADRVQIQQVVMNLVTNASEAIGDRPGRVSIRTALGSFTQASLDQRMRGQELQPGPFVTLLVEDDGSGMPEAVIARIFDPFFTTKPTGRGLGLSAIRGILRAHHAGIEIQSRVGEGTSIALHFPVADLHAAVAEEESQPPSSLQALSGILLLAEDEPVIRQLARQMSERLGFRVIDAEDGEIACRLFQEHQHEIRVAVLDLTMPRKSGAEVYRLIRKTHPALPILLCSGYSREAIPEAQHPEEARIFLQKPFSFTQFEKALRALMHDRT